MKFILKWFLLILTTYLSQHFLLIIGINTNLSFLLIYFFIIEYYFPKDKQRNIAPSSIYPLMFFLLIGFMDDLLQGIWGPAIISKSISGFLLINLTNQLFFNWTEQFKGTVIFIFTLLDEIIYSGIIIYFFNISIEPLILFKQIIIRALFNIPLGLFISWGRP